MKKRSWYEEIKVFLRSLSDKKNMVSTEVVSKNDAEHGYQLDASDLGEYLSRYLPKEHAGKLLKNVNSSGYLSYDIGITLKSLLGNPNYDTYIKSIHDSQVGSIFNEGIRCLGKSSSMLTINPGSIDEVNLDNTITVITDFPVFISRIKGNYGISEGGNKINGTLIIQIPKGTSKQDILYFNENSQTYNIKPTYILGFIPVDEFKRVKEWIFPDNNIEHISYKQR